MDEVILGTKLSASEGGSTHRLQLRYSRKHRILRLVVLLVAVLPGTVAAFIWVSKTGDAGWPTIVQVSLPWIVALSLLRILDWLSFRRGARTWYGAENVPP